jgi:hypothetical protein
MGAAAIAGARKEAERRVGAQAWAEAGALTGGTKNDVMSGDGVEAGGETCAAAGAWA